MSLPAPPALLAGMFHQEVAKNLSWVAVVAVARMKMNLPAPPLRSSLAVAHLVDAVVWSFPQMLANP
eukprot:CAMPEP_0169324924 /NCGR_PEP_ID=MMETSP1017-20121227/10721_1 /TAXON_ID=342587 /ORGANISM="Karlodinium micrum, Strain CCMP2283" /LENGTH=66 /DNA_ID=CAMNT_0009419583 /DNA_START=339 /DNA_END=539 /DNA_ORIENTATION=+